MKIAVLGKGVEGNAVAEYFKNDEITFFEKFTDEELDKMPDCVKLAAEMIRSFCLAGADVTMNQFNRR